MVSDSVLAAASEPKHMLGRTPSSRASVYFFCSSFFSCLVKGLNPAAKHRNSSKAPPWIVLFRWQH